MNDQLAAIYTRQSKGSGKSVAEQETKTAKRAIGLARVAVAVPGACTVVWPGATVAFVHKQFSPDFYITCATVIPLLFLAVTLQGPAWGWILSASERAGSYSNPILRRFLRGKAAVRGDGPWQWTRTTLAELMTVGLVVVLLVSVTACGLGEGLALCVLYRASDSAGDRRAVLMATLFLVAAVLAAPLLVGVRALWLLARSPWLFFAQVLREPSGQARGAEPQGTTHPKAGAPASDRTTEEPGP